MRTASPIKSKPLDKSIPFLLNESLDKIKVRLLVPCLNVAWKILPEISAREFLLTSVCCSDVQPLVGPLYRTLLKFSPVIATSFAHERYAGLSSTVTLFHINNAAPIAFSVFALSTK